MKKGEISKNLASIKKELNKAHLIAVSKYSPIEDVIEAYHAHHYDFGENRVDDLKEKSELFKINNLTKVRWHFIGHLQTNKVREIYKIPNLYAIHSVDSISLLKELIKREKEFEGPELKIFFQVNTSHESEKYGFSNSEELNLAIEIIMGTNSKCKFYGLMTMGTIRTKEFESEASRCFQDLSLIARNLENKLNLKEKLKLSMGMSQDYKLALLAGSDFIRVGSAIFKSNL